MKKKRESDKKNFKPKNKRRKTKKIAIIKINKDKWKFIKF